MSWFERYTIPGAYFILLTCAWMFPWVTGIETADGKATLLIGLGGLAILPIGYLLCALGQALYLTRTGLLKGGLDRAKEVFEKEQEKAATPYQFLSEVVGLEDREIQRWKYHMERQGTPKPSLFEGCAEQLAEPLLHSHSVFKAEQDGSSRFKQFSSDGLIHNRDWTRRRTNVLALNDALRWATLLAFFVAGTAILLLRFCKEGTEGIHVLVPDHLNAGVALGLMSVLSVLAWFFLKFSYKLIAQQLIVMVSECIFYQSPTPSKTEHAELNLAERVLYDQWLELKAVMVSNNKFSPYLNDLRWIRGNNWSRGCFLSMSDQEQADCREDLATIRQRMHEDEFLDAI